MKRGNAGSWNSGLEKEQILETYSAHLQKSWNSTGIIFRIYKKYWAKKVPEGGHPPSMRVGARPTPLGAPPASWATWPPFGAHLLLYEVFRPRKNKEEAFGMKHRRLEEEPGRTNLGLWRSCSTGGTSLREGEIIAIVITNAPLIGRGPISINIFTSTISSQNLVHLLYPTFVPKPHIGTCGLLVVLITPCSWC